jgi:diguanylate cyclase (GGDEF)-like protein
MTLAPPRPPLDRRLDLEPSYRMPRVTAVVQPILRISDGAVFGYEALARMSSPPELPPDQWLEVADRAGHRLALERACLEAIATLGAPPSDGVLFVNASPALLSDPQVLELRSSLPGQLVIELTEREAVGDYHALRAELAVWRASGVRLAIDDTGSGWSTLRHVLQLHPDFIKLDQSLVSGVDRDRNCRALVCALATFARESGVTVIAEGVERREELDVLRDAGVSLAQGWLFARAGAPWPLAEPRRGRVPAPEVSGTRDRLMETLNRAPTAEEACDVVADHLHRSEGIMPSVYLEQGGLLRCRAQRGLWQVLDGMPSGSGVTGRTFLTGEATLLRDITRSPDYLEAIPGVVSEFCVPIEARGERVGALNVESFAPFSDETLGDVRDCAEVLGRRLETIGAHSGESMRRLLARHSAYLSSKLDDAQAVGSRIVEAAIEVAGMDSAALAIVSATGELQVAGVKGPLSPALAAVDTIDLDRLAGLVERVASCHTAGDSLGAGFVGTERLRIAGARAVAIVPLVARDTRLGILIAASTRPCRLKPHEVETLELLAVHAATCLDNAAMVSELRDRATQDPLTGLRNHSTFHHQLDVVLGASGPERCMLLLADIDRFKTVNDTAGHLVGDDVLREVANAIQRSVREQDQVFRLGGDEFAAIIEVSEERDGLAIAQRVLEATAVTLGPHGAALSIGVATAASHEERTSFVERADRALYRAKRERSGIQVAGDGQDRQMRSSSRIEDRVSGARRRR